MREQEKLHKVRQPGAMLIFATKIKSVKFVIDFLRRQGTQAELLHGQLPQSQRERALADFKAVSIMMIVYNLSYCHIFKVIYTDISCFYAENLYTTVILCKDANICFFKLFFHIFFYKIRVK